MVPQRELLATRLYGLLLELYPVSFKTSYGPGMLETFRQRAHRLGRHGWLRYSLFLVREFLGLGSSLVKQRIAALKHVTDPGRPAHQLAKRGQMVSGFLVELRYALRRLLKTPAFSIATILTLGVGIGATTAIFSVIHSVVLSPLPYPESDRLVWLSHRAPGLAGDPELSLTPGIYTHYRDHSDAFEEVAIFLQGDVPLVDGVDPQRVSFAQVTSTFDQVFRVPPIHGRWIHADDRYATGVGVVVLSDGLWSRRYGSDPDVLGRSIQLSGIPHEVIGVMPRSFAFPDTETDLWLPRVLPQTARFGGFTESAVARLRRGVTPEDAAANLDAIIPGLIDAYPDGSARSVVEVARIRALVTPLRTHLVGDVERALWIVFGTVGLVLLIACANVANLILVRTESRQREVAVRMALGAGRASLVRFFLAESSLLAFGGGVLGVVLAYWGVRLLVAAGPSTLPRLEEIAIHPPVLAVAALISLVVSLGFGVIPLLRSIPQLAASLKEGARTTTTGGRRLQARTVLVVTQIALALLLLVGAGLMVRSFWQLQLVDPGFDKTNVLTFQIGLPRSDYPDRSGAAAFHQQLVERLAGLPGVTSTGAVSCLPLSGWCGGNPLYQEGVPPDPNNIPPIVAMRSVAPGYFATVGTPLRSGRVIQRADHETGANVAVVSERLVEIFWPGQDPIGRRVNDGGSTWYTIVGVVGDVQTGGLTDGPSPLIYYPMDSGGNRGPGASSMTVVLRTAAPPLGLTDAVRNIVHSLDPNIPIARVQTLERLVSDSGAHMAFTMVLLAIAAIIAVALGTVGVYAVVAYVVAQRHGEIGIRMALGAGSGDVRHMVLRQGGGVALVGIAIGLGGAFALTRFMHTLLFGVSRVDPLTFGTVCLLLFGVTLLSSYIPARRAARIDPVEAMRAE